MADALWITLIGMGLVFLSILLLWGLMALLVRLSAGKASAATPAEAHVEEGVAPVAVEPDLHEQRRLAAAVGVAAALAMKNSPTSKVPAATAPGLSVWQTTQRASQLARLNGGLRKVQR